MARKSHAELKMEKMKAKNAKLVGDSDYFMRDKEEERKEGNTRNTLDMTPPKAEPKKAPSKVAADKE